MLAPTIKNVLKEFGRPLKVSHACSEGKRLYHVISCQSHHKIDPAGKILFPNETHSRVLIEDSIESD